MLNLTAEDVALRTGLPRDIVDGLIDERLEVTAAIAVALEVLGLDRAAWLAAQGRYNDHHRPDLLSND